MSYQQSMHRPIHSQPTELTLKEIVERILSSGQMSRQDYSLLTSTALARGDVRDTERRQINRVFDHIQTGRLKLTDW